MFLHEFTDIEKFIMEITAIACFILLWHSNSKTEEIQKNVNSIKEIFDGLKDYLYEIDPQFEDERSLLEDMNDPESLFASKAHHELLKRKEQSGKRTLFTKF